MSDRFAVEADRRVVGVAVRAPGGFRFFSSEPAFFALEGRIFARARTLVQSAAKIARKLRRRPRAGLERDRAYATPRMGP
ncbi:MAG: hypothetical protein ACXWU1_03300 [Allosphingosinicella sp.]